MFPTKLKCGRGYGIEVTQGFVSGDSGGPKWPAWVSVKLNSPRFPLGKSNRLQNLVSSNVLEWAIVAIGCNMLYHVPVFGTWYKASSRVTPHISLLKEESWCWVGVSGEEVYVRFKMVVVGISRGFLLVC